MSLRSLLVRRMVGHRHARHRAYSGVVLVLVGIVGYLTNPATVVVLVLLTAAVECQIRVEARPGGEHVRCRRRSSMTGSPRG